MVLSLDGRREINDAMRPNAGGKGSYDTIVPKYQQFVAMRGDKDYYVRGTFTKNNLDFSRGCAAYGGAGLRPRFRWSR